MRRYRKEADKTCPAVCQHLWYFNGLCRCFWSLVFSDTTREITQKTFSEIWWDADQLPQ